jgi:hypothetical protein
MVTAYISWHYGAAFRRAMQIAANFIIFALHLFSVRELIQSFFAPWRRIVDDTSKGGLFSAQWLWAVWDNVLSRVLGAIARAFLLALGAIFFVFIAFGALLLVIGWVVGPVLPPMLIALGFFMLL